MKINEYLLALFLMGQPLYLLAQIDKIHVVPFEVGERLTYEVYYEWGILEITGAVLEFNVQSTTKNNEDCFHFMSVGRSLPEYDFIFSVIDTFQSIVSRQNFEPLFYIRNNLHNDHHVKNTISFNKNKNTIDMDFYNSEIGTSKKSIPYEKAITDLQTIVYHTRILDYESATIGQIHTFNSLIDGNDFELSIEYEGKEDLPYKDEVYECFKISTYISEGEIVRSDEKLTIWITNDNIRVPLKVEAPMTIGQVIVELVSELP
jgi:hypothetical protein